MREIGSDFGWHPLGAAITARGPWERSAGQYVQTGRQALFWIATELRSAGVYTIHAPEYHCDSMIAPLMMAGLNVEYVPVDSQLWMPPEAVETIPSNAAVLHAPYFGQQTPGAVSEALAEAQSRGVAVVLDLTHSFLAQNRPAATYAFASLRKLLAVPDGAWVEGVVGPRLPSRAGPAIKKLEAMRLKCTNLSRGAGEESHLIALEEAEAALVAEYSPHRISDASRSALASYNYADIAASRRKNHALLKTLLAPLGLRVINADASIPSHTVLSLENRDAVRANLIDKQIYCPIHWPRAERHAGPWRGDLLSVPIDQRYDNDDMRRIASALQSCGAVS